MRPPADSGARPQCRHETRSLRPKPSVSDAHVFMAQHVVIIGNGITGVTAARFIRKLSDSRITIVSGETDHFYARTALMYIYMGHMRYRETKPYEDAFWDSNRIELLRGWATKVNTDNKTVTVGGGRTLRYDTLLLATGSKSNFFGWPGQDLDGVQGLYGVPDLVTMERWTAGISRGVVVGGGLIGIEMAEMLHSRHIPVTFLVREESYMDYLLPAEESAAINAEITRHNIDLRLSTELATILPNREGRARGGGNDGWRRNSVRICGADRRCSSLIPSWRRCQESHPGGAF